MSTSQQVHSGAGGELLPGVRLGPGDCPDPEQDRSAVCGAPALPAVHRVHVRTASLRCHNGK